MINKRKTVDNYIIDFSIYENWEDFEKIALKLVNEFGANILEKSDGPESRIWNLEINNLLFSLHHNPYGNYIKAQSPESAIYLDNQMDKLRLVFN